MSTKPLLTPLYVLVLSVLAPDTSAAWSLDNDQSKLSFVSIKATNIGEVHTFSHLSGGIADDGTITVEINLASVETLIPIRNDRMQEFLFETSVFPRATISARLDHEALLSLVPGTMTSIELDATLTIKDRTVPLKAKLFAARLGEGRLMVASQQPVLISASSVGLSAGVEKLRDIAGLPSISQAVPVSFIFTFDSHN